MVYQGDALADRAAEESGANVADAQQSVAELFSCPRDDFGGYGGGFELQRETNHEKGVRVSDVAGGENRVVSSTRSPPGARIHPQILLTRRLFKSASSSGSSSNAC